MQEVSLVLAFGAGLLAFISPCTLPLYPSFISYITGVSVQELKENKKWKLTLVHSISFCLGFSTIYYILGFSASALGSSILGYQQLIQQLGGILLVLVGLFLIGFIQPTALLAEYRIKYKPNKISYLNTFVIGLVFSAGWTACIGPIFGTIMYTAMANPTQAFYNITAFSLGFSIPFILMGLAISKIKILTKYSNIAMKIGGWIIIILGITIFFNKMYYINILGQKIQNFILSLF
ncbi:cytochrome c biogenesis protein CcdA [Alkalihalophilus lindianensis]|uniref:Cytochrome c biogenesis protein CcdA n=1 Tax=Alkalihalophilus lindianensis TaxID=1630542 RepID=A0ABU3XET7_9BACI|nr:cytochrome c biogenesis protein CcdA [Alkalihalophilus lindianensis]MDV2686415.1 cytochrome c biogenesis protein CcdA [Alkalihalophilus lindianensis]